MAAFAIGWVAIGPALATSGYDYHERTFNSCLYWVSASFDTSSPNGSASGGDLGCASWRFLNAYFWNGSSFVNFSCQCASIIYPYYTVNVYGYSQIQKPLGSWSPTIEAHAY